jgi:hypothetical protein
MKTTSFAGIVLATFMAAAFGPAGAQTADDRRWINECITDNKDEGQTEAVIVAYCTCMNDRMSNSETRSITQWEKANPRTSKACSRQAGWRGR